MLLIVDAQVNQFEPPMAVHDAPAILSRLVHLVGWAREAEVPVTFIQNDGSEVDPDFPGSPGWALHPELRPVGHEKVYRKTTTDSFHETGLLEDLRAAGVTTLVIAGMQSDHCINATTRRAVREGFRVTLVSDTHSTFSFTEEPAAAIISKQNQALGAIATLATATEVTLS
ncbi:MAG: cysteine hydrolase family protein [Candidatus Limnocylindrus sp.]